MGYYRPQVNQKSSFNFRIIEISVYFGLITVSSALYLAFKPSTFSEYCDSFYTVDTFSTFFIVILELKRKTPNIFDLITNFENIIEPRKEFISEILEVILRLYF